MNIQSFIQKTRWTPNGPTAFDSRSNYSGPDMSEWCQGPGHNRDSDILAQSNFDTALEMLGGEREGIVEVHRFGHWACGWYEVILVNPNDSKTIQTLFDIHKSLENYPVLDDSDYSEREWNERTEWAEDSKGRIACVLIQLFGLPEELEENEDMLDLAFQLQMEHQSYNGNDSSLYDNPYHVDQIDKRRIQDYESALKRLENQNDNPAYQLICSHFGIETRSEK